MIFGIDVNRLQPLFLQPNQQHGKNVQGPFIENCIGISPRNWSKKNSNISNFDCFFFSISSGDKSEWSCSSLRWKTSFIT